MRIKQDIFDEDNILITCALRFNGSSHAVDNELYERFIKQFELFDNPLDNFNLFYSLQRFLYKWGGEYALSTSHEWKAFRLLFLNLCDKDVPPQYRNRKYYDEWQNDYLPNIDRCAKIVKASYDRYVAFEKKIAKLNAKINSDGSLIIFDPIETSRIICVYSFSFNQIRITHDKNKSEWRDLTYGEVNNIRLGKGVPRAVSEYFKFLKFDSFPNLWGG